MKISVVIKEPGKAPRLAHIENSLECLQETVGGYIETLTLHLDAVVICDEEGRLKGLPYCCTVCGVDFVGTVIFAGVSGDNLTDLPGDCRIWQRLYPSLWEARNGEL